MYSSEYALKLKPENVTGENMNIKARIVEIIKEHGSVFDGGDYCDCNSIVVASPVKIDIFLFEAGFKDQNANYQIIDEMVEAGILGYIITYTGKAFFVKDASLLDEPKVETCEDMKNFDYKALILSCVDLSGYAEGATLREVYMSEYGNFRGNPCIKDCRDYLQGLPSVCTIPFYNSEIYALLGADPDADPNGSVIDQYWYASGKAFKSILNNGGI